MMSADCDKIICIDDWRPDDSSYEKGYYPEGTRDKAVYFSPADVTNTPLRPKWRYLFKESRTRTPWQFWMEIIAYRIGQIVGVPVPPAYVGLRHGEDNQATYAALIEWFYSQGERYVDGARVIGPLIPGFDPKTGKPHSLKTILDYFTVKVRPSDPQENRRRLVEHWALVLAFDTVIGNVDRHPENWGIVGPGETATATGIVEVRMSPAFDNGTGLSYEQPEEHFSKFNDESYVRRYLTKARKARHHMQWGMEEEGDLNFFDFMRKFVREFPQTKGSILSRLQFSEADLRERLGGLPSIPVDEGWRLTPARLEFTLALVMKRAKLLREALENI